MDTWFASSLFVRIFGDSPVDVFVNSALIAVLIYFSWRLVVHPIVDIIINISALFRKIDLGVLEITPPKQSSVQPLNTQSLFAVLQQQFGQHSPVSFEIAGSKKDGIRYRVVAARQYLPSIQKQFASYMPELKFKQLDTFMTLSESTRIFNIRQTRHFAYPLKPHEDLDRSDPIAFIAGSMTRLHGDEEVALQLVVRRYNSRKAQRI